MSTLTEGAQNDTVIDTIRRFLPPAFRNKPGWEACIAGLGAGDGVVRQNVYNTFAQLFLSSASGQYLIQRAADRGIDYPENAGITEELFRELAILLSNERQITKALMGILEVFYGYDSTRAHITSVAGPFNLTVGDTLVLMADDTSPVTVTVEAADFRNAAVATPDEIAAVITRAFYEAGSKAFAVPKSVDGTPRVVVYAGASGLLGSIRVTGGLVNRALLFPTAIPWVDTFANAQWQTRLDYPTEMSFVWKRADRAPGNINEVRVGDYFTLDAIALPGLRGSYEVIKVVLDCDIAGNYADKSYFTVRLATPYEGPWGTTDLITSGEMVFFRPTRVTALRNSSPAIVSQPSADAGIEILMPVTTQAVGRAANAAAYLHDTNGFEINEVWRIGAGIAVKLVGPLVFALGQNVELRGVRGSSSGPTPGTGGWNVIGQVATPPGAIPPGAFWLKVERSGYASGHGRGGFAHPMSAPADNGVGPYLFDSTGFAVTSIETTTSAILAGGRGVGTLVVANTAGFSEESWAVIGFGTEFECGPIRCLGVLDSTNLAIDRSFIIPREIPAGTSVILLASKGAYQPDNGSKSFILTDSVAGRVAAESFLDETVASGIPVKKIIVYPGDRGLGGEGDPTTGIQISDKVAVWASDNVDAAVEAAHNA